MYKGRGLEILAFPCNQFGHQEPGSPAQIKHFVAQKGVQFNMMQKITVNGPRAHPLYKLLKGNAGPIKWNFFTKFLVMCDDEKCTIERYDNAPPPKALIPNLEPHLKGEL